MPEKSSSSANTTVTLTTLSIELPASSRMADMFFRHCRVCSCTVSPMNFPVTGSAGEVPDTKINPAALTAWLYVAGGLAALSVNTIFRDILQTPLFAGLLCEGQHTTPAPDMAATRLIQWMRRSSTHLCEPQRRLVCGRTFQQRKAQHELVPQTAETSPAMDVGVVTRVDPAPFDQHASSTQICATRPLRTIRICERTFVPL